MKRTLTNRLARLEREALARAMRAEGGGIIEGETSHVGDVLLRRATDCGLVDRYGRIVIGGTEAQFLAAIRVLRGGCPACGSETWDRDHEASCRWAALPG